MFNITLNLAFLFLLFQLNGVFMYRHQKALKERLWSERCKRNSVVLNDCNWCWCDQNQRYQCKARVCEEVDMFGHFKDAIQELDVGMEGRGSWRSRPTSCSPGVHYRRGNVLCVCDEDGNWPNPVCRDLFRVLHTVEVTGKTKISPNDSCIPNKLHLVGCSVCFCPSSGYIDPELCMKKDCDEGDPVLDAKDGPMVIKSKVNSEDDGLEVYATCERNYTYELGCKQCDCIGNNRLLCDNCSAESKQLTNVSSERPLVRKRHENYCKGRKAGKIFKMRCNSCHCDKRLNLFCTAKRCIKLEHVKLKTGFRIKKNIKLKLLEAPADDQSCISGSQYKKDCNTCKCIKLRNGIKIVDCTLNKCDKKNPIEDQKEECLANTYYELDCKVCHCHVENGVKHQVCQIPESCGNNLVIDRKPLQSGQLLSTEDTRGYCEPLHKYKSNCNMCRCLSDGKTFMCESKVCIKRSSEALSIDIVPVYMKSSAGCPKGHSYRLGCNLCFCLSNGNAICTTADCSKKYEK